MYVDSHCHLQLIDYTALNITQEKVVANALAANVNHLLCVATNLDQTKELFSINKAFHKNLSISIGLHPNEQVKDEPELVDYLNIIALSKQEKINIAAIGETGLDYYRLPEDPLVAEQEIARQQTRFRTQIRVAKLSNKPLIIHTRSAKQDTLRILQEEQAETVGGVFHCFTENWEYAEQVIAINFHISFSGIVTFKQAQELQTVAKLLPLERMFLETDSPYLAPMPLRGKINQPAYIPHIGKFIANLRNDTETSIAQVTTNNYFNLF